MPGPFNPNAVGSVVPLWAGGGGGSGPGDCQDCGNTERIDLYINPTTGNDGNLGTSASPIATIAEAVRRLLVFSRIGVGAPIMWHLSRGPHTWTPIPQMLTGAALCVYADPVFDPTVRFTFATGTSQAGTGQNVVVTSSAFVTDEHIKRWIMFTDGPAAGEIRSIRNNTATDITPLQVFSVNPGVGSTWVVFDTNCVINAPAVNGPVYSPFAYGTTPSWPLYRNAGGIVLFGLAMNPAPNSFWSFGSGNYEMYGCRWLVNTGFAMDQGNIAMGGGTANTTILGQFFSSAPYIGYGNVSFSNSIGGLNALRAVRVTGYVSCDQAFFSTGIVSAPMSAIRASTVLVQGAKGVRIEGSATIPSLIRYGPGAAPPIQSTWNMLAGGGELTINNTTIEASVNGPIIRISDGAYLALGATTTGQNGGAGTAVLCRYGSRITLNGPPAFGKAAPDTDWDIEDGAPFDKSFFAAVGNRKFYLGNLIVRTT